MTTSAPPSVARRERREEQRLREQFERDKVCYEQNFQQFRSLNQSMWQVPILAMTLNGGLWFAATTVRGIETFRIPLFLLSAVFNISLIFVLVRVRYVMGVYLDKLRDFHPQGYVSATGDKWYNGNLTVLRAFSAALGLSALCSLGAVVYFTALSVDWRSVTMTVRQSPLPRNGCTGSVYDREALDLSKQYESVRFEDVHQGWIDLIPTRSVRVLDVGAGSGRDAAALAARGHDVTAVEPSEPMLDAAKALHSRNPIAWIADCLPALTSLREREATFDLVLLSAVWMHIPHAERDKAAVRLAELMAPSGLLIVTLRHGPANEDRGVYEISDGELIDILRGNGLILIRQLNAPDALGREAVSWMTLVFKKLPVTPTP